MNEMTEETSRPTDPATSAPGPGLPDADEPRHTLIERDAVAEIIGETVVLRQGAVQRIDANQVEVKQAGVLFVRADALDIAQAGVGGVLAGEVNLELTAARFVGARDFVRLEQSAVALAAANTVEVAPGSAVGVLIARTVNGDVRPLFDWRAAAAFGVVAGIAYGIVRVAFGRRG